MFKLYDANTRDFIHTPNGRLKFVRANGKPFNALLASGWRQQPGGIRVLLKPRVVIPGALLFNGEFPAAVLAVRDDIAARGEAAARRAHARDAAYLELARAIVELFDTGKTEFVVLNEPAAVTAADEINLLELIAAPNAAAPVAPEITAAIEWRVAEPVWSRKAPGFEALEAAIDRVTGADPGEFPGAVYVRGISHKRLRDNGGVSITHAEKYYNLIETREAMDHYLAHIGNRMFTYESCDGCDGFSITFDVRSVQTERSQLSHIAKLDFENCVLNCIRAYCKPEAIDRVYKKYPTLKPVDGVTTPSIESEQELLGVARSADVKIEVYSPLGKYTNKSWATFGKLKAKKVSIKVQSGHATIMPGAVNPSAISYLAKMPTEVPQDTSVIDFDFRDGLLKFYTTYDRASKIATIHKTFRPSSLYPSEWLLEDSLHRPEMLALDADPTTGFMFSKEQVFKRAFTDRFSLSPIRNEVYRELIKSAEMFPSRGMIAEGHVDILVDDAEMDIEMLVGLEMLADNPRTREQIIADEMAIPRVPTAFVVPPSFEHAIETDMNRNYASYKTSPYYIGFPDSEYTAAPLDSSLAIPAFVVLATEFVLPPHLACVAYLFASALTRGIGALPYPTYKFLIDQGCQLTVKYGLYCEFQDIDLVAFSEEFSGLDTLTPKYLVNSLIGRTITGGISENRVVSMCQLTLAEVTQVEFECAQDGYRYEITEDGNTYHMTVELPNVNSSGLFHFHSYILSYAAVSVLTKWLAIEAAGHTVLAYNVDAIVYEDRSVACPESDAHIGGWKYTRAVKAYYTAFSHVVPVTTCTLRDIKDCVVGSRPLPKMLVITGAAGLGKSHPFLATPYEGQIICTPTHRLKTDHKRRFANTHTVHKARGLGMCDAVYATRHGRAIDSVTVVDEIGMLSTEELDLVIKRTNGYLVMLFDDKQIISAVDGTPMSLEYLRSKGAVIENKIRVDGAAARQDYAYGCVLDMFRELEPEEQYTRARDLFGLISDEVAVSPTLGAAEGFAVDHVIVGNHTDGGKYNKMARDARIIAGGSQALFPFRVVVKHGDYEKGDILQLPCNTPTAWWGRTSIKDSTPKGMKFEPGFAITSDAFQGMTLRTENIAVAKLVRHGTLYTAITRCVTRAQVRVLA